MLKVVIPASAGVGMTAVSTFASSLGLSVHQERIGFAVGVALIVLSVVMFLIDWRSKKTAAQPSLSITQKAVELSGGSSLDGDVNAEQHLSMDPLTSETTAQERVRIKGELEQGSEDDSLGISAFEWDAKDPTK